MTSFTPGSAMTSFTDRFLCPATLTAEGARRATEAVKVVPDTNSSQVVIVLINNHVIQNNFELLLSYVDRCNHILVESFRRQPKLLAENVQHRLTTNESHHVITTALWLRQRMLRCARQFRKAKLVSGSCQSHLRRTALQLSVAISGVMLFFKGQRFPPQLIHTFHGNSSQEPTAVMVIELFYHAISPRLSHRYEPEFDTIGQTETNQTSHAPRVAVATIEDQLIIYLLMLWYSQTPPVRPDSVDRRLRRFVQDWAHRTAAGGYVHTVHTVKAQRPTQVTRTHIIALMH